MAEHPRARKGRTIGAAVGILVVGLLLIFSPLLWGRWSLNKYFVATGIIVACWGLSATVLGLGDLLFER